MFSSKAVAITAVLFAVVLTIDASKQVGGARTCSSNGTCGFVTAVLTQQGAHACDSCIDVCVSCQNQGLQCNPDADCSADADCSQCNCNCH